MTDSETDESPTPSSRVPLVDYLRIEGAAPHLVARECTNCGARFFDRRNACAKCSGLEFAEAVLPETGTLRTFTIVYAAAPGVAVPFVAGVIDCGGTSVRANVINVAPDAERVKVGMPVRLATYAIGTDMAGREAVAFGFEPVEQEGTAA